MVAGDDDHRPEPAVGLGQDDGHRTRVKVHHGRRVEGVAIGPDDGLPVDLHRRAVMEEAPDPLGLGNRVAKVEVGFGPHEVLGSHRDGRILSGLRQGGRACRQKQGDGGNADHDLVS